MTRPMGESIVTSTINQSCNLNPLVEYFFNIFHSFLCSIYAVLSLDALEYFYSCILLFLLLFTTWHQSADFTVEHFSLNALIIYSQSTCSLHFWSPCISPINLPGGHSFTFFAPFQVSQTSDSLEFIRIRHHCLPANVNFRASAVNAMFPQETSRQLFPCLRLHQTSTP